jgi:hypothetical protein
MATMFGQPYRKEEILARIGHLSQVAGIRMMQLNDGRESGVRVADVRTGSGLRFQVSLDRGMDISLAEYKGIPLAWRSPQGDVHPSYYDPRGFAWARSFPGGLMTGCGMTYFGPPCLDQGDELGLHGRLSNLPAFDVRPGSRWDGDALMIQLDGCVRESTLFKENMLLHRFIESGLGESVITLRDTVRNEGQEPTPLMMLYHVNLGWPVVDAGSRLMLNSANTTARDAEAERGLADARNCSSPIHNYKEQVFNHDLVVDNEGFAVALVLNTRMNLGVYVRFRKKELPWYAEWKMMGESAYVMGLEPANCGLGGRAKERAAGALEFLNPGEERHFLVHIGILEGEKQIGDFAKKYSLR